MFVTQKSISRRIYPAGHWRQVSRCPCWMPWSRLLRPRPRPSNASASSIIPMASSTISGCRGSGANWELSPTLKALEPYKDKTIVVTGLSAIRPSLSVMAAGTIPALVAVILRVFT